MMKHCTVILILLGLMLVGGQAGRAQTPIPTPVPPHLAGLIHVPGTGVSMIPPDGYQPAPNFQGFYNKSMSTSIVIMEMPIPYDRAAVSYADSQELKKKGLDLLQTQDVKVNGRAGKLQLLNQNANGRLYVKWTLLMGDKTRTVIVTAGAPPEVSKSVSFAMIQSLMSVIWNPVGVNEVGKGLPYTIQPDGALRPVRKMGTTLLISCGKFPISSVDEPVMVLAPGNGQVPTGNLQAISEMIVKKTASVSDVQIQACNPITVDGIKGFEILAHGREQRSGKPATVYQVSLFDAPPYAYFLIVGIVASDKEGLYLKSFQNIARSLKRTATPPAISK